MKHLNANYNAITLGPLFDKPNSKKLADWMETKLNNESDPENFARLGLPQILDDNDSTTGQQLKEKGFKSVRKNNESWMEVALVSARRFVWNQSPLRTFTGEDIRFHCLGAVGEPAHPNAWGALISTLIKRKIIVPTGEYRPMKDSTSHARKTPVYKAP